MCSVSQVSFQSSNRSAGHSCSVSAMSQVFHHDPERASRRRRLFRWSVDESMNVRWPARLFHVPVAALFLVLSVLLTWPLSRDIASHVPGTGADDNMMFLWNFWWMR